MLYTIYIYLTFLVLYFTYINLIILILVLYGLRLLRFPYIKLKY